MKIVKREDLPSDYKKMMQTESHHNHEIVSDEGILRWKPDNFVSRLTASCSLAGIVAGFDAKGTGKNSEIFRELHRMMGYSLKGYWEVFYWEINNEDCADYVQPETTPEGAGKKVKKSKQKRKRGLFKKSKKKSIVQSKEVN